MVWALFLSPNSYNQYTQNSTFFKQLASFTAVIQTSVCSNSNRDWYTFYPYLYPFFAEKWLSFIMLLSVMQIYV